MLSKAADNMQSVLSGVLNSLQLREDVGVAIISLRFEIPLQDRSFLAPAFLL